MPRKPPVDFAAAYRAIHNQAMTGRPADRLAHLERAIAGYLLTESIKELRVPPHVFLDADFDLCLEHDVAADGSLIIRVCDPGSRPATPGNHERRDDAITR